MTRSSPPSSSLGTLSVLPIELKFEILSHLTNVELIRYIMPLSHAWTDHLVSFCIRVRLRRLLPLPYSVIEKLSSTIDLFSFFYAEVKNSRPSRSDLQRLTNYDSVANLPSTIRIFPICDPYYFELSDPPGYFATRSGSWVDLCGCGCGVLYLWQNRKRYQIGFNLRNTFFSKIQHDETCRCCRVTSFFRVEDFRELGDPDDDTFVLTCSRTYTSYYLELAGDEEPNYRCPRAHCIVLFAFEIRKGREKLLWVADEYQQSDPEELESRHHYGNPHPLLTQGSDSDHAALAYISRPITPSPPSHLQTSNCDLIILDTTLYLIDRLSGYLFPWLPFPHFDPSTTGNITFESSPYEKHALLPFTSHQYILTTRPFYRDLNHFGLEFLIRDATTPATSDVLLSGTIPMEHYSQWLSIGEDDTIHFESGAAYAHPGTETLKFYYTLYASYLWDSEDEPDPPTTNQPQLEEGHACSTGPAVWTTLITLTFPPPWITGSSSTGTPSPPGSAKVLPTFTFDPLSFENYPCFIIHTGQYSYYTRHFNPIRRLLIAESVSPPRLYTVAATDEFPLSSPAGAISFHRSACIFTPSSSDSSKVKKAGTTTTSSSTPKAQHYWPALEIPEPKEEAWVIWTETQEFSRGQWDFYRASGYAPSAIPLKNDIRGVFHDRVEFSDRVVLLTDDLEK